MSQNEPNKVQQYGAAFVTGLVFAVGLALSGMTQPAKVIGFFDFSEGLTSWDPSLAFVMGGGMLVYMPVFRLFTKRTRPLFDTRFRLPTRRDIDLRLLGGAALFGIGWGLGGYCPGPALTSAGALSSKAFTVVGGMLIGMFLFQQVNKLRARRAEKKQASPNGQPEKAVS